MQLVATLAVVVSVLVLAYQGRELAGNTRVANEVAGTQAHRELLLHYKAVTDAFIRYPELDAYFFDKTTETPSAHDSVRLSFVADQYADWLHAGFVTSQRLASYAHWGEEWTSYIPQALASSSWLRAIIRDNPGVYPSVEPFVADYDASHEYGPDRPTMAQAPTAIAPRHLAERFYESFDAGDIGAALSVFSDDLETIDPGLGMVYGHDPFREYIQTLKCAVPDARAVIQQTYESGEAVIVEGRFVGTFTGPLPGPDGDIQPTGAGVDLRFADVSLTHEGKIVSYHTYYDQLGLLTQLGLMND
jgi:ketosteroid isomerase-like protein